MAIGILFKAAQAQNSAGLLSFCPRWTLSIIHVLGPDLLRFIAKLSLLLESFLICWSGFRLFNLVNTAIWVTGQVFLVSWFCTHGYLPPLPHTGVLAMVIVQVSLYIVHFPVMKPALLPVASQMMGVGASGLAATWDGDLCVGIRNLDHNSLYQCLGWALGREMVLLAVPGQWALMGISLERSWLHYEPRQETRQWISSMGLPYCLGCNIFCYGVGYVYGDFLILVAFINYLLLWDKLPPNLVAYNNLLFS